MLNDETPPQLTTSLSIVRTWFIVYKMNCSWWSIKTQQTCELPSWLHWPDLPPDNCCWPAFHHHLLTDTWLPPGQPEALKKKDLSIWWPKQDFCFVFPTNMNTSMISKTQVLYCLPVHIVLIMFTLGFKLVLSNRITKWTWIQQPPRQIVVQSLKPFAEVVWDAFKPVSFL